ncbi:MAG: cupredoxin family copper-binding protein [Candidatus Dormibacteraeota bacterium]|uniref:Amidase n=1 Tax=Candidatus Aeolococcus gillhamiae TaxID=3127015 RepID=A0A2W5YXA9_9BACT|nr:cupredoxin family copper-binding protein [Candidatus Dormibacteraeota bacterium]PZR77579.1 MAG: amidase [Candidatus Dormibacter sp. RRmetagenome_bin12]
MRIHLGLLTLVGISLLGVVACGSDSGTSSAQASSGNAVTIKNFAFGPSTLQVSAGTSVTWTNNDQTPHTSTAEKSSPASWDSANLAPGASFSYTFAKAGTYTYHCNIHQYMTGSITIH